MTINGNKVKKPVIRVVGASLSKGLEANNRPLEGQQLTASFWNSEAWMPSYNSRPLELQRSTATLWKSKSGCSVTTVDCWDYNGRLLLSVSPNCSSPVCPQRSTVASRKGINTLILKHNTQKAQTCF